MTISVQERIRREQQKLHRAELHLARLKTKINKARQTDARMKLRLGNLIYLVGWEKLDLTQIEQRIVQIKTALIEKEAHATFQEKGQNALDYRAQKQSESEKSQKLTADEWRELNHQKITIGGLLVKHQLEKINRATLFGALLEQAE